MLFLQKKRVGGIGLRTARRPVEMPAPGPKDGHMSKSSRDLSKGIAVKSNGFKYGGGRDEGWGTGQAKGRRLGKGQGERDVAARERLKARLLARTEARARGEPDPGVKRKRDRGDETRDEKGMKRVRANDAPSRTSSVTDADEQAPGERFADEKHTEPIDRPADDAARWTCSICGVKCGTRANFDAHRDSKKHRAAAQRAKGKAILEAMRAGRARGDASS